MIHVKNFDIVFQTKNGTLCALRMVPFGIVQVLGIGYIYILAFTNVLPHYWVQWLIVPAVYVFRMLGVTIGYHRYFSHNAFRTSRAFQFVLAWWALLSAQKGPLWWATHHRHHHRYSDKPEDIHSVRQQGFWWAHVGWLLSNESEEVDYSDIKKKFPWHKNREIYFLNKYHLIPSIVSAVVVFGLSWWLGSLLFAISMLGFACFIPLFCLYHGTFTINSLAHVWGTRRYETNDDSRNNLLLALITMGEGWHNNHHKFPRVASQGRSFWEIDIAYLLILYFRHLGLVWDVKTYPARAYEHP